METIKPAPVTLLSQPADRLLNAFGAGNASPGSGSAAALMGLLAAKLLTTVCDKSLTKAECKKEEKALSYIREQVAALEPVLVELFEKDAKEFDRVVALRIARNQATDPNEKSALSRQANELLETATDNAFRIIDACMKLIDHGVIVFEVGWSAIRGDSGAGLSSAMAGVMSGIFIANLNLKSLGGRRYATENIQRCAELYSQLEAKQAKAFSCVTSLNAEALSAIQLSIEGT